MNKNNNRSKLLEVAKKMPPLKHSMPNEEFDIRNSEVVNWLIKQPDILNYIWNNIKNTDAVKYSPTTGKWQGVDY